MKKIVIWLCILAMWTLPIITYAQERFADSDSALTNDIEDVAWDDLRKVVDPIREGSFWVSEWLNGIYNEEELTTTGSAWEKTLNYVKWILNYILWIIWLVSLWYMILQWFRALTAWSNEEELNKAIQWIKYAAFALAGVWLSWFVLSIIFWFLQLVTNA